jgi:hypothetical protein
VNRYPDLLRAYGTDNYEDALEHWLTIGEDEGRDGRPDTTLTSPLAGSQRMGGDGGSPWSDSATCKGQHVIGWRLRAGRVVDMVQFKYPGGWAEAHGARGSKAPLVEENLRANEHVVRIDYGSGSSVDRLKFTTNKGRTFGPSGGGGGGAYVYTVTPGEKLGCVRGRQGAALDQLIFSSTGPR